MSDRRWWEKTSEEIYAYRTRKPHGFGLPVVGRHWAYVGRTSVPHLRHSEHMVGGGKWRAKPKPWADLEPRRFVICRKKRRMEITTHFLEWFWIKVLMPVYNVSMNRTNPRRIKPWTQAAQRAHRNQYGQAAAVVPAVLKLSALSVVALAVLALVQMGR
jgi:hypothetical protein